MFRECHFSSQNNEFRLFRFGKYFVTKFREINPKFCEMGAHCDPPAPRLKPTLLRMSKSESALGKRTSHQSGLSEDDLQKASGKAEFPPSGSRFKNEFLWKRFKLSTRPELEDFALCDVCKQDGKIVWIARKNGNTNLLTNHLHNAHG